MSVLYLFNPENDLALANGGKNYTPPPLARTIARDLSTLPLWYATEGENIICLPSLGYGDSLIPVLESLGKKCRVCSIASLPDDVSAYRPWGWSPEIVHRFLRHGADAELLPRAELLDLQRVWAHRIRTREVLSFLKSEGVDVPYEIPVSFRDEGRVHDFVTTHLRAMLKAPWSGSGKGLCRTYGTYDLAVGRWVQGVLRCQGEVVCEPYFEKEADMAMEFLSDGNRVVFSGYSWFSTDERGAYKGNCLLSDDEIEKHVSSYLPVDDLYRVRECLERFFTRYIVSLYQGYFGVDMMIYRRSGAFALHPCVEINLRMNMGMVSRIFYDRYVAEGSNGVYRVEYFPDAEQLMADHCRRQFENPLRIDRQKIKSGYLALNPILPDTHYRASVEMYSV